MSTPSSPIVFRWDGDAMIPASNRFALQCDRQYVVGEVYTLVPHQQRSAETHRHYFAAINDAWQNLSEDYADQFPTSEHLRKWALIKAGFADQQSIVAASKAEAVRLAAFVRPLDTYSVVTVSGPVVTVYTAKSQSMRAMGKAEFQRSKEAVLDVLADMIGVNTETLSSEAGRAA